MEQIKFAGTPNSPKLVAPPPVLYLATFGLALSVEQFTPAPLAAGIAGTFLGSGMIFFGILLARWAFLSLRQAGTSGDARRSASALVIHGPFAFSRNPVYLAMTLMYSGLAVIFQSIWPFILLPVLAVTMHLGVITREESYLNRRFGRTYAAYCVSVRRWL